jgi:hypothetical protein
VNNEIEQMTLSPMNETSISLFHNGSSVRSQVSVDSESFFRSNTSEIANRDRRNGEAKNDGEANNDGEAKNDCQVNDGEANNGEANNGEANNGEANNGEANNGEANNGEANRMTK